MIKAICFDLDGVYFTEKGKKAFHKNLVELSNNEEQVSYVLYKSPEMHEFVTGKLSEGAFWQFIRDSLQLNLTDKEFRQLWVKEYEIDNNVRTVVLQARSKGYLTCICSNNNVARVEELDVKFKFLADFDVKIFSYQTGFVKPQKEIFESLIKATNVQPNELVYSDDNPDRIQGAKELGINTFIFENFNQFLAELKNLNVDLD